MAVAQSMMDLVFENASANGAKKITRIDVAVGNLSGVAADSLSFCFDALKSGTIADGALLAIDEIIATAKCPACAEEFRVGPHDFLCAKCGGPISPNGGRELSVKSIEVE
ncbi:MAG: hydrogenase maturation nickel metallochaperone HypA [Nitrospinae bacterium]|nr:hydrogenase maturation nickel metallochaperone HypA [Nitrospinota bacterium]